MLIFYIFMLIINKQCKKCLLTVSIRNKVYCMLAYACFGNFYNFCKQKYKQNYSKHAIYKQSSLVQQQQLQAMLILYYGIFLYKIKFALINNKTKMAQQQNLSEFNRFLINNRDFLLQKYTEYFTVVPPPTLKTLKIQSLIDYIYDIFSFNKYRKDERTHEKISRSITKNIHDFIYESKSIENNAFTAQMAIEILTYCIQHNDMFSVQYDVEKPSKNNKNIQEELQTNTASKHQDNIRQTNNLRSNEEKNASTLTKDGQVITKTISSKSLNKAEDQIFVNITKLGAAIQNRHNQIMQQQQSSMHGSVKMQPNQFDNHERISVSFNPEIIKKNAKLAFFSFCKNQMELGGHRTFDNLEEDASTMTIGKLLVYAKAYNMLNELITKEYLMQRFKRISDGKRAIDFQKFYALITEMHIIDPDLFNRLELMEEDLYKKLKFVKYPFYTKDQNPRQLKFYRNFINKLTGHSGKTHKELKEEITTKRMDQKTPLLKLPSFNNKSLMKEDSFRQRQKMLSPKDLTSGARSRDFSIELSFIDKIVSPEDNDLKYLGQYEIQHLKRHMQQDSFINNSSILRRKDSIVSNIKKRIQQIQSIENSSTLKRSSVSRRYAH